MEQGLPGLNYPDALPVVARREDIVAAIRDHQVVVVVSETGSGKTTQLPKMVAEVLAMESTSVGKRRKRLIGCTQPRRIAASSVAERVAEELGIPLGGFVGYQVRFDDRTSRDTRIKFMTDGILLAETQGDPDLGRYGALILDEAHERSLNIDFLLGYLKRLLPRRPDLKLVISSATLDAGSFVEFFTDATGAPPALIEAEGRTFPVEEHFLPPWDDEDLGDHVVRAVEWLNGIDGQGDVLVFLPGEREIRDCAEKLEGRRFPGTEILPLYARLGLSEQQRVFHPGPKRRVVLATNVAETSLTIPRIVCVVDSGLARVSRWSPGRGVQRLQIEEVSQASARQRKGRCGRVRDGVCVRLYDDENLDERPEFTDPEIRRSSLAGVILQMKSLGLPEIEEFPFIDPPAPKAISEGYRTLREVGALDKERRLTDSGRLMAGFPVDPRLARMILEAREENCLEGILPVIAGLETQDPKERPAEKAKEADAAHKRWSHEESDFMAMLALWVELQTLRKGRRWQRNQLRKFCRKHFLNFRRVTEWANVHDELKEVVARMFNLKLDRSAELPRDQGPKKGNPGADALHRSLLAGAPKQFGLWDREEKVYRSASGGQFAIFPGSGVFGSKRWDWVMGMELVETTRLWARRVARIDPQWIEQVAPHLCRKRHGEGRWDPAQGAVYAKETVLCGGLPIVAGRRVHFGRINPEAARRIFLCDGLLQDRVKGQSALQGRLKELRESVELIEHKLRRRGGLWSEEAVVQFLEERLPEGLCTTKAFHRWCEEHEESDLPTVDDVVLEDLEALDLSGFPDELHHGEESYSVYYHCAPGERDDGVTIGVHVDQLGRLPDWVPGWGVPGDLEQRAEWMIRSLPKDFRRACQPVSTRAREFAEHFWFAERTESVEVSLAKFLSQMTGHVIRKESFDLSRMPEELVTKVWVCDDQGEELAMGVSVPVLREKLGGVVAERFEAAANEEWEFHGLSDWPDFEIPESIETESGPAYPALVDERDSVGCRAYSSATEARESHRAGVVRLLMLQQSDQVSYLKKKFPLDLMAKLELPRLDAGVELLIPTAAEGALGLGRISSASEFTARADAARGGWWTSAEKIATTMERSMESMQWVRTWIAGCATDRHLAEVAADIEEQMMWLFRRQFPWRSGYWRTIDYDRQMHAIRSRIDRLSAMPISRDLDKMDRVRGFWEPWFQEWQRQPDDASLWDYGWLLLEYRTSLFAPDVSTREKVSEKRLSQGWG